MGKSGAMQPVRSHLTYNIPDCDIEHTCEVYKSISCQVWTAFCMSNLQHTKSPFSCTPKWPPIWFSRECDITSKHSIALFYSYISVVIC